MSDESVPTTTAAYGNYVDSAHDGVMGAASGADSEEEVTEDSRAARLKRLKALILATFAMDDELYHNVANYALCAQMACAHSGFLAAFARHDSIARATYDRLITDMAKALRFQYRRGKGPRAPTNLVSRPIGQQPAEKLLVDALVPSQIKKWTGLMRNEFDYVLGKVLAVDHKFTRSRQANTVEMYMGLFLMRLRSGAPLSIMRQIAGKCEATLSNYFRDLLDVMYTALEAERLEDMSLWPTPAERRRMHNVCPNPAAVLRNDTFSTIGQRIIDDNLSNTGQVIAGRLCVWLPRLA